MFNSKLFGKTIKAMRKNRKFSLLCLSLEFYLLKKVGIDNRTLYNIKRNGNITLLTLEKLCREM